jgi:hypothetical protein
MGRHCSRGTSDPAPPSVIIRPAPPQAGMAELVDALDSKETASMKLLIYVIEIALFFCMYPAEIACKDLQRI